MPTKQQGNGAMPNSLEGREGCVLLLSQTLVLGAHVGSGAALLLPCSLGLREGLRDKTLFSGKTEMWEVSHLFCRTTDLVHTANKISLMGGTGAGFSCTSVFLSFQSVISRQL